MPLDIQGTCHVSVMQKKLAAPMYGVFSLHERGRSQKQKQTHTHNDSATAMDTSEHEGNSQQAKDDEGGGSENPIEWYSIGDVVNSLL